MFPKTPTRCSGNVFTSYVYTKTSKNFVDFEAMVISILTLALCYNRNKGSFADESKEFLKFEIRCTNDTVIENVMDNADQFESLEEYNITLDDDEDAERSMPCTSIDKWIEDISNEVVKNAQLKE